MGLPKPRKFLISFNISLIAELDPLSKAVLTATGGWMSIPPEILEPARRQVPIACGVLNISMPEVWLDRPGVLSVVGQFVAGCMTQHVRVDRKLDARLPSGASYDLSHRMRRQRSLTLTHEHIGSARILPLQPP